MDKTVFILGAGFSIPAGAPSQANLIGEVFKLNDSYKGKNKRDTLNSWIEVMKDFIVNKLYIKSDCINEVALEDIFTPLDRCILDGLSFREIPIHDLESYRNKFYDLIVITLRNLLSQSKKTDREYVDMFSKYIIEVARKRVADPKWDKISIITTNWDILLDNSLKKLLDEIDPSKAKDSFEGVVDYCCHISSLDEGDEKVKPGLYALGKGKFNVKLLKLHGSMNWLQCPKCQRVYVKFYKTFAGGYVFADKYCRHCQNNFSSSTGKDIKLHSNLIMPTFLKDLNNFQIKLIWQNAGIELSEANKIVFMGYSLPTADFELRQLLARMIKGDAKIDIVLTESDNPKNYPDNLKYTTAGYRFNHFFSGREKTFFYDGVVKYVKENLVNTP